MRDEKITCKVIIQMAGTPKEHLEKTIKSYVDKLKTDYKKELKIIDEFYGKAKKEDKEDSYFNVFCELEIIFNGAENITWFAIDYLPSSIEVLSPSTLNYKEADFTNFLNDLLSKLHKIDLSLKGVGAENKMLKKNGTILAKNLLKVILSKGSAETKKISRLAGMPEKHVEKFLDELIKEGKIKKEKNLYRLL